MLHTTNSLLASACDRQTNFYKKVEEHIQSLNYKFREKTVIKEEMKNKILQYLSSKHCEEFDAKFKSWCRVSFSLRKIGLQTVLCDSKTKKPILTYERMYDVFKEIHEGTAHGGRDKCLDSLSINYSWYNRQLLQIFLNNCQSCQQRQSVKIPVISKPIIALEYMTRVQMDLIDMRTRPDASSDGKVYRWILQLKDHFTKFCWARGLEHKEAKEVYKVVREIFFLFGAPRILQSDNGREFVNELINSLRIDFPGLTIVHGRPRHPQSQGLIERANAILTNALGKWMEDHSTHHWSEGLSPVIYAINTRTTHTTKKTPYQLVFGQELKTDAHYWNGLYDAAKHGDVEMGDLVIDKIEVDEETVTNEESQSLLEPKVACLNIDDDNGNTSLQSHDSQNKLGISFDAMKHDQTNTPEAPFVLNSARDDVNDDSPHEFVRKPARENYLKAQSKRQEEYDTHLEKIADSYKNGDIVGVSINKVDRTNCDPKIMPCLIEKRSDKSDTPLYHLISPFGRLSVTFPVHRLIPMSGIPSSLLNKTKFDNLKTISFVQASKLFARGNPGGTCDCRMKCRTKVCPCRRASISCSTKCHSKLGKCSNMDDHED